jgi:hypothetical protein
VLGYDRATLQQVAVFNDSPNGFQGGIWLSGNGPAADGNGNIFVISGNGTFDANTTGGVDFGDSFLKLNAAGGLALLDFFTPFDQAAISANDFDLGSSGPLLLPDQTGAHPHLVLGAGKNGTGYLVDRDNMGHFNAVDNSQIVQTISVTNTGGVFGAPAFWQNNIYFSPDNDVLKAYQLSGGLLSTTPTSTGNITFGFPGATPVISANGSTNGIVWILDNSAFFIVGGPAVLHAYDATNVSVELWSSSQADNSRDQAGPAVKFTAPTVANGKVYVGGQGQLTVYGLLP